MLAALSSLVTKSFATGLCMTEPLDPPGAPRDRDGVRNPRMTDVDEILLQRMVAAIVDAADPEQVILFGSRARGDARPDSDVDLVVVEAEPFGPARDRRAEIVRLMRAVGGMGVAKDVLVYSRDEVEYWRDSLNNVLARALREGRVLYERPQAGARSS